MQVIKKYDDFKTLKLEIVKFNKLLNLNKELPNHNELVATTKAIIFFKKVISHTGSNHYRNCFIYDILSIMHSLTKKSKRQFHYIFRSFIENFTRSMLNLNDNDETGVNQLFKDLYSKFGDTNYKIELIDFIYGEYGKSCLYVHSNSKADTPIQLFYRQVIENDDFTEKILRSTIMKILVILKKMIKLLACSYPSIIEDSFYRKKQELEFLIGKETYKEFITKLKT